MLFGNQDNGGTPIVVTVTSPELEPKIKTFYECKEPYLLSDIKIADSNQSKVLLYIHGDDAT